MRSVPEIQKEERRRFERVDITHQAQVLVLDGKNEKAGVLRQLARGGFMMEPEKTYNEDKLYSFVIHEPTEDMRVRVNAKLRFSDPQYVGFEFIDLDGDSAVQIGQIIGKYYEHSKV